jgi:predicted DNA-binding transcriptional regulator AlpA
MPQHTPEPLPSPLAHRIENVVRLTGASRTRIYAALKAGELEAVKIGRTTHVLDESMRRWVAALPRYAA